MAKLEFIAESETTKLFRPFLYIKKWFYENGDGYEKHLFYSLRCSKPLLEFEKSNHCNTVSYSLKVWRLYFVFTNRVQLFEEKRLPKVKGWWANIIWCKKRRKS